MLALPVHNQGKSTATPSSLTKSFKCKSLKSGKLRKLMSTLGYYYCAGHAHRVPRHHITTEIRNGKVIQPTDKLPKSPELLHQHSKQKLRTTKTRNPTKFFKVSNNLLEPPRNKLRPYVRGLHHSRPRQFRRLTSAPIKVDGFGGTDPHQAVANPQHSQKHTDRQNKNHSIN